ncbi:hypothetical protein CKA32_007024 [Geitlerinema sp. FC II]|nr:hypothetical protein CKA32_007024 [Geitlerinema sp. FC II]
MARSKVVCIVQVEAIETKTTHARLKKRRFERRDRSKDQVTV